MSVCFEALFPPPICDVLRSHSNSYGKESRASEQASYLLLDHRCHQYSGPQGMFNLLEIVAR